MILTYLNDYLSQNKGLSVQGATAVRFACRRALRAAALYLLLRFACCRALRAAAIADPAEPKGLQAQVVPSFLLHSGREQGLACAGVHAQPTAAHAGREAIAFGAPFSAALRAPPMPDGFPCTCGALRHPPPTPPTPRPP